MELYPFIVSAVVILTPARVYILPGAVNNHLHDTSITNSSATVKNSNRENGLVNFINSTSYKLVMQGGNGT